MSKNPMTLLGRPDYNNDNLHLIAISNLQDNERRLKRWWASKYKTPARAYDEHMLEELLIERLEDFYENHPAEAERFMSGLHAQEEWNGAMPHGYEDELKKAHKRFFERNQVDLSKYQSEETLTSEQEEAMLANLGRHLPKSSKVAVKSVETPKEGKDMTVLGDGEFDDTFEVS